MSATALVTEFLLAAEEGNIDALGDAANLLI